jgi:hypothetical protein
MEEGFSLKSVSADAHFTFSGTVKTKNGARSVVLLCTVEAALTIVVLPYGVIAMRTDIAPAEPRDHMATLQRVRCARAVSTTRRQHHPSRT